MPVYSIRKLLYTLFRRLSTVPGTSDGTRGVCIGYGTGTYSRQLTMDVWSIEDEVPQDSPARFIEVIVDSLDLQAMGFEHTVPAPTGRQPYNPYNLVKLYVLGYPNRVRSSRRLMRECTRNIELV